MLQSDYATITKIQKLVNLLEITLRIFDCGCSQKLV